MVAMAEPVTVDLTQLDAFHDLLPALAGSLDIRDVFQRLSEVASRIVPHDEANLLLATDDGTQYRLYASTGDRAPDLVCREDHCVLREPATAVTVGDIYQHLWVTLLETVEGFVIGVVKNPPACVVRRGA